MKIKSLGSNKTELELKDLIVLISYQTPVAAIRIRDNKKLNFGIKTSEFHSITTSNHINHWLKDKGINPDNTPTAEQEYFNTLLDDNTG